GRKLHVRLVDVEARLGDADVVRGAWIDVGDGQRRELRAADAVDAHLGARGHGGDAERAARLAAAGERDGGDGADDDDAGDGEADEDAGLALLAQLAGLAERQARERAVVVLEAGDEAAGVDRRRLRRRNARRFLGGGERQPLRRLVRGARRAERIFRRGQLYRRRRARQRRWRRERLHLLRRRARLLAGGRHRLGRAETVGSGSAPRKPCDDGGSGTG